MTSEQRPPLIAPKSPKRKTPLESLRAGAKDDSLTDNPVTDPGMNTTTNQIIGTELVTSAEGQEHQVCSCGWSKVTSIRRLKIHQGRMKCLKKMRLGPCIDHYLLRKSPSQASEAQWQDSTHSPLSISTPEAGSHSSTTSENLEPNHLPPASEKNMQGCRPQVKRPKSRQERVGNNRCRPDQDPRWNERNSGEETGENGRFDLLLWSKKIQNKRDTKGGHATNNLAQATSRRQKEIECLVKERRD